MPEEQRSALFARITHLASNWSCILTVDPAPEDDLFLAVESPNMILFSVGSRIRMHIHGGIHWDGEEWSVHT
jgi:hypothetical protein